jgi:hypothetical protein
VNASFCSSEHNQLAVLAEAGLVPEELSGAVNSLPRLVDPTDPNESLENRARSYLHAQCAHCHQPDGWTSPSLTMDLRYSRTLSEAQICNVAPMFFRRGEQLVAPREPEQSAILIRLIDEDLDRMPPLATTEVDRFGAALVADWIATLPGCPSD